MNIPAIEIPDSIRLILLPSGLAAAVSEWGEVVAEMEYREIPVELRRAVRVRVD
jgi:hypothetical protein